MSPMPSRDVSHYTTEVNMEEIMKRITVNQEIFAGKPIIRGMRISVELILRINTEIKSHFSYRKEYFRLLTIFPVKPKIYSVSEI